MATLKLKDAVDPVLPGNWTLLFREIGAVEPKMVIITAYSISHDDLVSVNGPPADSESDAVKLWNRYWQKVARWSANQ